MYILFKYLKEPSEIIQDTHTDDTNNNEKKLILPIDESVINGIFQKELIIKNLIPLFIKRLIFLHILDKKPNLDLLMIELLNALTYLPLS